MKKIVLTCAILLLVALTAVSAVLAHAPVTNKRANAENETVYIANENDFLRYVMNGVLDSTKDYVLTTDIYLNRYYLDKSVRANAVNLNSNIDGRGHSIVGLKEPLFNYIYDKVTVKNLNLIGVDIDTNLNSAALANVNLGIVTNVKVTGNIKGTNVGGIVVYNFGTINNSVAVVDIDATGLSGYIAVTNSTKDGADALYSTIEGYVPTLAISDNYGRAVDGTIPQVSATYADGTITESAGDYVGSTIDNYVELEYYLLTYDSTQKSLGASINLYNTSLLTENNVKLLSEFQTEGSCVNRGWYIFYNSDRISEVAFTPSASTDTAPAASVTLNGSGSKEDPYKINTPSDFLALGSLESGYAMLTAPITLGLTIYDYYVDSLKVNLDGNGYAIEGLSKPLFNSVSRDVLISNLTVIGDSEYYIALANNGTLNAVNVYGNGGYSVKTNADFGIISRASVNIIAGGVAEQSLGKVEFTRNLGGGAFFANESDGQVVSSYQDGSWNATNIVNSVRFTNDEYVVSEGALEDLIDYKTYSAIETIKKGWQFAQELGWGFVGNVENDIPTLVFPEDNLSYKLVTRVKNPYASVTESFGANSASISRTMRTLLDYTYNANPELYPVMDEENDLYYDFDNIYQLVPSTITPFSRNAVECAIKHSFSNTVRTKLNEDAIFNWTYRKAGETEFKPIGSLVDFALIDGALTEYKFSFSVPYAYASGTFSVYESYGVLEINYMSSAYGKVDLINKLGLNNLQNSLIDLGYTQIDPLDPLGFDGVTVSITDAGGNAIGLNDLVYTVGRYTINVTIEPTASTTGYNFKSTFEITKGNLDLSDYEITSFVGGLTQSTALTYNAGNIINLNNNFRLKDYPYSNYSILVDIVYLSRSDYSVVYPTEVQDAGTYKLSLTIRVSGYDDYVREVYFYVNRQLVTVSTAVSDEVIEFYDAHPDVIYISALGSQAGLDDKLSYSSDYFIGADANATYTVTVNVANANSIYNYEVRAGSSATFRVVPANLDVSNVGFETKSVTYNGQSHSISVDTAKIGVKQFDTTPYEYTITYKYGDLISNEPFGFVDAGNYAIYAIITSSSSNYNVAQTEVVNLKINGLRLTLAAKDAYVNFGDDPVYDLTAVATDPAEEIAEDYVANLGLGEAIYMTSSYVKGVTAGGSVLENDIVFKRVDGTEIIGSKVGNYIISVTVNGTLTIGKRTYALDMVTSYSYTGKAVKLDFKGETFNYSATYKRHNLIEDTYSDLGADVPISACAPNYEYIVVLNIAETNEYYGVNDYQIAFTINPIDITISGLCVTNNSSKTPLTADMEVPYNGKDYVINIDSAELPYGVSFVWEFRYKLYNNTTEEYDYVSSNAIRLKDVTKIKDVELTLKTSVGNYNYNGYESAEFLEVTRFEIVPKEVKFTAPEALIYQGEAFSNEQIKAIVNALDYQAGYEVVEGDVFNYSVSFDEMLLPGDYSVIVASKDANYYVSEAIAVSMTHATTTLNFNDIGVLEFYYGEVKKVGGERYPKFTRETAYSIGLYNGVDNIDFRVDCEEYQLFLVPDDDLYDVISVDPLYKDGIKCVEFNLTGGLSKIKIKPLEVTFDWAKVKSETEGFKAEYEYTGEVISFYASFNRAMVKSVVEGLSVVTDPAIRITLSGSNPFKHVGEYTFTAESRYVSIDDDFQETSCFVVADSVKSFVTAIVPKTIVYEVEQKTIYIGDNFPLIFDVTYPQDDKSPHANDVLSYDYVAPGFTSNAPGSFSVTVTAQVVDGGQSYSDYNFVKLNDEAKELIISYYTFGDEISVPDYSTTYSGTAIEMPVLNLPENASVVYSATPVNAGEYDISVTIQKQGFIDKSFEAKLTISKATPYVIAGTHANVAYSSGYVLSSADITASATFNGAGVDGTFSFSVTEPAQTLVFGEHTYKIDFTPADIVNFNLVKNVSYKLTSALSDQAIIIKSGNDEITEVLNATTQVTINVSAPDELATQVELYVNGELVGDSFTFTASANDVSVEVKLNGNVVYTKTIDVVIATNEPSDEPSEGGGSSGNKPSTGNKPSNGSSKPNVNVNMDENTKQTLIIVGASVGGVVVLVGIVIAIVVILKKKGVIGTHED